MTEGPRRTCSREFPGAVAAVEEAELWVSGQAREIGLNPDAEFAINLCVEELFLNAVQHGGASRVTISVCVAGDGATVEFVDDGAAFDPTAAPSKRINGPNEDFTIGGYGVGLIRKFSRRMGYLRADGANRLVLEFDLSQNNLSSGRIALSPT